MSPKSLLLETFRRWLLACAVAVSPWAWSATDDLKIPNLGESSTSLFSADY